MRYIFRRELFIQDMGFEYLDEWVDICDGKEVFFINDVGRCGNFFIDIDWCEEVE